MKPLSTPCRPLPRASAAITTLAVLCALGAVPAARADQVTENFNGASVAPWLQFSASDPGFGFGNAGGWGGFTKADGTGNGFGYLRTTFTLSGDFFVNVDLLRDGFVGQGEAGLDLRFFPTYPSGFADVFAKDVHTLATNVSVPVPPGFGSTVTADVHAVSTLFAHRIGHTLTLGADFATLQQVTAPELAGPVTVELFLGQESGNTVGHHAFFDNLWIRGNLSAPVPEPASYGLFGAGLLLLGALRARRIRRSTSDRSAT